MAYNKKKMVITFPWLFLPYIAPDDIQSVSFTSSENMNVKQRRINTVDFILVVMAGGFVSSFLREVQSTIDQVVLTHVSSYKPASYPCHAPGMPLTTLKKKKFLYSLETSALIAFYKGTGLCKCLQMVF